MGVPFHGGGAVCVSHCYMMLPGILYSGSLTPHILTYTEQVEQVSRMGVGLGE